MTPPDLQRRIAELKGWTRVHEYLGTNLVGLPPGKTSEDDLGNVPNWHTDLTLAIELGRELSDSVERAPTELEQYGLELYVIVTGERYDQNWVDTVDFAKCANATAAQRCEAYLRVKEKQ